MKNREADAVDALIETIEATIGWNWVLSIALAIAVLWAWIATKLFQAASRKIRQMQSTHILVKNLLGAPDMENGFNTLDNDMLMHVASDLLSHKFSYNRKYYPPDDVVALLRRYAEILEPYEGELRELGWTRIPDFREYTLKADEEGRVYIEDWWGSYSEGAVRTLAEVAEVFSNFPTEKALKEEIPKRLEWRRVENLGNALAHMSPTEQVQWLNEKAERLEEKQRMAKEIAEWPTPYESEEDPAD